MLFKLVAVACIFLGEFLAIGAELFASKWAASHPQSYLSTFGITFIVITLGGAFLIVGYMLGYFYLKNIWIIAAISIGSILIVEPILAYALFSELPTTGAAIGLVLGVPGTLAALFL